MEKVLKYNFREISGDSEIPIVMGQVALKRDAFWLDLDYMHPKQ